MSEFPTVNLRKENFAQSLNTMKGDYQRSIKSLTFKKGEKDADHFEVEVVAHSSATFIGSDFLREKILPVIETYANEVGANRFRRPTYITGETSATLKLEYSFGIEE
jgi:hypothetical protein